MPIPKPSANAWMMVWAENGTPTASANWLSWLRKNAATTVETG